jgi:uncharacterized Zn finger protein (UPF0148 family)
MGRICKTCGKETFKMKGKYICPMCGKGIGFFSNLFKSSDHKKK